MRYRLPILTMCLALLSSAAAAHHPTGGATPATFSHGLLSGLGHPVIGLDHFAFVVGIGLFAAVAGLGLALPLLFVAFMAAGLALHLASVTFPAAELLVGVSVIAIGLAIIWGRTGGRRWLEGALFALVGTVHGYAYAEAIVGAETGVLAAYVLGLVAVQMSISASAYFAIRAALDGRITIPPVATRVAGFAIMATGAVFAARASGLAG
jgi:urease accessory protein